MPSPHKWAIALIVFLAVGVVGNCIAWIFGFRPSIGERIAVSLPVVWATLAATVILFSPEK